MSLADFSHCGWVPALGCLVVLLVFYVLFRPQTGNNEPPGPRPLPFVGNLLMLDLKQPYTTFIQLSKKYGPVFSFHWGPKKVVVLCGYRTLREALLDHAEEFGERDPGIIAVEDKFEYGVVFSNGEIWKEMRRFALTNLRDFGMGRKAVEDKVIEECGHLLQHIKAFRGRPFDPKAVVSSAVANIICSMVFGSRYDNNDPDFKRLEHGVLNGFNLLGSKSMQLYQIYPSIGKWISKTREEYRRVILDNGSLYAKIIGRLKETLDPSMCRGIVDTFLKKQQKLEEAGMKDTQFHSKNLLRLVANLFAGGTETTATSLRWSLLFMAKYPLIQDEVREEICRVIGSRPVQTQDRKDLPFTNAVIHETQRLANILPLALPHRTSCDVTFQGHFIKKGTTVFPVLASALYDENEWEKPHSFHPAHFLNKDGQFVKRDSLLPFSAGRRLCVGEGLARVELFLFFVSLVQSFRFTPPPGVSEEELDLTPGVGSTRCPGPHQLCAVSLP